MSPKSRTSVALHRNVPKMHIITTQGVAVGEFKFKYQRPIITPVSAESTVSVGVGFEVR
jgi:hypothetical protein